MRKSLKVLAIAGGVAAVAIAIAVAKHNIAAKGDHNLATDALRAAAADLALAQLQDARKYPLTEIPDSKPTPPRDLDVASAARQAPIVRTAAEPIDAQTMEVLRPQVTETVGAPAPAVPSVLVVPRPTAPTTTFAGYNEDSIAGNRRRPDFGPRTNGRGPAILPEPNPVRPGVVPFGGAIIRGGVGDDDHCDPRPGTVRPGGVPVGGGPITPSGLGGRRPPR